MCPRWLTTLAALLGSLLIARPAPVCAQGAPERDFQIWTGLVVQNQPRATPGLAGWMDLAARRLGDRSVSIVRPGIGVQLSRASAFHVGYAAIGSYLDRGTASQEHRLWEQFLWSERVLSSLLVTLRPRLEQRFDARDSLGHRARLFARLIWSPAATGPVAFVLWDEYFHQLNDTRQGQRAGYDQNRLFVGPAFTTPYGMRLELGYLNVSLNRRPRDKEHHILFLNLLFSL